MEPAGSSGVVAGKPAGSSGGGRALRPTLQAVTLGWVFGAVWFAVISGTPTTLFAKGLGASPFQFGLLAAMPFLASLVQLPASLLTERTGRRKSIFLQGHYFQRFLWLPIALAPLWLVSTYGAAAAEEAMALFLLLMFLMYAGGAAGAPAWVSWMADVVPDRVRGRYFSRRRQWGVLTAIPAALLVGWLLDRYGNFGGEGAGSSAVASVGTQTLQWCALIFLGAAAFGVADIAMFQLVPDVPREPRKGGHLLRALREPLRDRRFLLFSGFVATMQFAVTLMNQFLTLYLIDHLGIRNIGAQLILLVAPGLAQLVVLPVWGKATDRMGKRPVLAIASLGLVPVGVGWCLLGDGYTWLGYVLSMAGTALWTGVEVANLNLVLETSGSASKAKRSVDSSSGGSAYVAVNSVIINVAGCLSGIVAGLVAQSLRDWQWQPVAGRATFTFYDVLFALSSVLRLVAVVAFLPFILEPAARPTLETLRFMAGHMRDGAAVAAAQPLKVVKAIRFRRPAVAEALSAVERPAA